MKVPRRLIVENDGISASVFIERSTRREIFGFKPAEFPRDTACDFG
jgi:hypothetical protein